MDEKASNNAGSPEEPKESNEDPPPIAEEDTPKATDDVAAAATTTNDDTTAKDEANDAEEDTDKKSNSDDSDDDAHSPPPSDDASTPDDLLLRAMTHKEDGNTHFKSGDYTSATRSYRKGTNLLKKINEGNTGDEQVKQLLISLQTNHSMVLYRQKKHKLSRDVASGALIVDSQNVKALYRRAVAHRAMGDVDAARVDLRTALKVDPNNIPVKKELMAIKKSLEDQKAKEKARLSKAFSKKGAGSFLYSDKEEEEKRKAREAKEKEKLEEEKVQRRKKEWEDECVRRMASDPPEEPLSFEDWDKERKSKEEAEEKARKKAKKEEEDRNKEERRKARKAQKAVNKKDDSDDDGDELTESELKMLRGYKKTSDGRTTSYFNREQTDHEKSLIGCIKPKRLEQTGPSSPSSPTASLSSAVGSVWNQSGTTWEEKDTTDWAKRTLEQCLLDTTVAYYSATAADATYVAVVKKVDGLTGDASVAIAGGKKRYIYDFHSSLEYEIVDDNQVTVASGKLRLPDVNSATTEDEDELEVDVYAWTKAPSAANEDDADASTHVVQDAIECRKMLVQDVRKSVLRFVEKFNTTF
ncbi:hypothetical protein ACHAXR_003458 [Thalassiosira sp. AJA248-18]